MTICFGSSSQYAGVIGFSTNGPGIQGASTNSNAALFVGSSNQPTVRATNTSSQGGAAFYGESTATDGAGVCGIATNNNGSGVQGVSNNGFGIQGVTSNLIGVYGIGRASTVTNLYQFGPVGVWGDSTGSDGTAVVGSATNGIGGIFENNSSGTAALVALNYGSGPNTNASSFSAIQASTPNGTCGFGGNGDLTCTGQVKSLATTGNGSRTVETYSMQSPENWMEDFGSGTLRNGIATISLESGFAEIVSGTAEYHVFLTPNGDSKGLYVVAKTANSFEVRESGGGTSTIGFDYRIVAKRRGHETERMIDVSEEMKASKARFMQGKDVYTAAHK